MDIKDKRKDIVGGMDIKDKRKDIVRGMDIKYKRKDIVGNGYKKLVVENLFRKSMMMKDAVQGMFRCKMKRDVDERWRRELRVQKIGKRFRGEA
jgi:hypothetical protein